MPEHQLVHSTKTGANSWTSIAVMPLLSVISAVAWCLDVYPWTTSWWRLALAMPLLALSIRSAVQSFRSRREPVTLQSYQAVLSNWVAGVVGGVGVVLVVSDDLGAVRLCVVFCLLAVLVLLRGWIPLEESRS